VTSTLIDEIRSGARGAARLALNQSESQSPAQREALAEMVDILAAEARPQTHVVGLTGPPGVGKSTLGSALVAAWRQEGLRVGVLAVDPSSRLSGGALLGDRVRIIRGADEGLFMRSLAARDHLGGLSDGIFEAMVILRAGWDRVLIESVGVGQNETEIVDVVDTTVVMVQPAAGDGLQFMKSGLMEIPDIFVVNKADLGAVAQETTQELRTVLKSNHRSPLEVHLISAANNEGVPSLVDALSRRFDALMDELQDRRQRQRRHYALRRYEETHGPQAVSARGGRKHLLKHLDGLPGETTLAQRLDALDQMA